MTHLDFCSLLLAPCEWLGLRIPSLILYYRVVNTDQRLNCEVGYGLVTECLHYTPDDDVSNLCLALI